MMTGKGLCAPHDGRGNGLCVSYGTRGNGWLVAGVISQQKNCQLTWC